MQLDEFIHRALDTSLTEKQAETYYRIKVMGQDRATVACELDCSKSNVDNLRYSAESKIAEARRTARLSDAVHTVALE